MDFNKLGKFLLEKNEPVYRLRQIKKAVFQNAVIDFADMVFLPKMLRDDLRENFDILPFKADKILKSSDKRAFKALLKLHDGKIIETVLMSPKPDLWSVCVSSQVGCPMKCAFCATGKLGFIRNLSSEEIWGQVLFWNNFIKKEKNLKYVSSVVYMGMGEPFNNFENVCASVKFLTSKEIFGMSQRAISVSTCGILDDIEKFALMFPQINLAISLHSADKEKRKKLMPASGVYDLKKIAAGLIKYFKLSRRKVFIEYVLIRGVNDGQDDAEKLVKYLSGIGEWRRNRNTRLLLHVNLIILNPVCRSSLMPSSAKRAGEFKRYLIKNGFNATIRKSLGQDIAAACGQLAMVSENP